MRNKTQAQGIMAFLIMARQTSSLRRIAFGCRGGACLALVIAVACLLCGAATQESAGGLSAREVVKPQVFVSLDSVPRGRPFELAVVAKIEPGYHINAHKVLESFLIPTELNAQLPENFKLLETNYPPGQLLKFSFSENNLAVYTGEVAIRMRVGAGANTPLGAQTIPLILRYQACNDTMCLPPVKIPLSAQFQVAAAGAKSKPLHPEIFTNQKKKTT